VNSTIEEFYQKIGEAALDMADDLAGNLLVYAEVQDGASSCDLFYENREGMVRFKFCSETLRALVDSFWEFWKEHPRNREWRVMCYVIEGGKFRIDFTYPDQINKNEGIPHRRPLAIKKYFGDKKVDYSQP
jgi:hypothetical protein